MKSIYIYETSPSFLKRVNSECYLRSVIRGWGGSLDIQYFIETKATSYKKLKLQIQANFFEQIWGTSYF